MWHKSKFDGRDYLITRSYDVDDNDSVCGDHDVCLIWYEGILDGNDDEPRTFIGWYCGGYDYDWTEGMIQKYYEEKLKKGDIKMKTIDLPICYVNLITDCLDAIKKHNLFSLLSYDEDCIDAAKSHFEEVLDKFCKPLEELGVDTKIIIEEGEQYDL